MISRILIIQTAFLGDVILCTPLIKVTRELFPKSSISFLLIPETKNVLQNNPHLNEILVYDKKGKEKGLKDFFRMVGKIRKKDFDLAMIPHRYIRSALLAYLAGIPQRIGFDKGTGSFLFTQKVIYQDDLHEVDRNLRLLSHFSHDLSDNPPELFPSSEDFSYASQLLQDASVKENDKMVGIAPGSVWATKRWLPERFAEVSDLLVKKAKAKVVFLGSKQDEKLCLQIASLMEEKPVILAGKTSILQSAAVISKCEVILSNDSAPVHIASAMKKPVVAIFGSTIPEFGFGPYGEGNIIIGKKMECRPCGIHGKNKCPKKHFRCITEITTQDVFEALLMQPSFRSSEIFPLPWGRGQGEGDRIQSSETCLAPFLFLVMRKFNIAVIGTINKDTIILTDGKRIESFGGILYNILSLSYLGRENVRVYPVCNLGYDVFDQVMSHLKDSYNVEVDGIQKVDCKNNHAFLSINKEDEREEILTNRVPPLNFSQIKPFLKADVILVNFISGSDLSLKTLKKIRKETDALVFMDVHSLTLGVDESGKRFFHAPKNWREWVRQADIVQMNLPELNELAKANLKSDQEVKEFGGYILSLGSKGVLVTLAQDGALMIFDNKVRKFKGSKVRRFKDATGCGDVFSAGFLLRYLQTKDLVKSVNFANHIAAEKCRVSGTEAMKKLFERIATVL